MTNVRQRRGALSARTMRAAVGVSIGMVLAGGLGNPVTAATEPGQTVSDIQGKPASEAMTDLYPNAEVKTTGDVTIVSQGRTATEGWVEFTGIGTVEVDEGASATKAPAIGRVLSDQKVGGGRWIFGTTVNAPGQKACHSKFHHANRWHAATAIMDNYRSKKVMEAGRWAEARVVRHTRETCYTYWKVYNN